MKHISVSAAAIITRSVDDRLEILLTKRASHLNTFPNTWVIPGGKVDLYETREDAVIREVKEETGLNFYPTLFAVYDEIFESRAVHAIVTVYEGHVDGDIQVDPHEVSEIGWFSLDDALAPSRQLGFEHRQILTDYVQKRT